MDGDDARTEAPGQRVLAPESGVDVSVAPDRRARDITEQRLRRAQEIGHIGCWEFNVATREVWWSDELSRILGLDHVTAVQSYETYLRAVHPEDLARVNHTLQPGAILQPSLVLEHRVVRPDGGICHVRVQMEAVFGADGRPVLLEGTVQDISALEAVRLRLTSVLDGMSAFVGVLDAAGRVLEVNRPAIAALGFSRDQVIGVPFLEGPWLSALPEERARIAAALARALRGETGRGEFAGSSAQGIHREIDVTFTPLRDGQGQIEGVVACGLEVTERNATERAARKTSDMLQAVVREAPVVLFALDRTGRFEFTDGRGLSAVGGKPNEAAGEAALDMDGAVPGSREKFHRALAGEQVSVQYRSPNADFEVALGPRYNDQREVDGVIGVAMDVTERRRAEDALRESEARYRTLFENAREGIYETTREGTVVRVNRALALMLGYDNPDDLAGCNMVEFYADRGARQRLLDANADEESIHAVELEWKTRTGARLDVEMSGQLRRDAAGTVIGYHGIVRDVTEQHQMDAARRVLSTGLRGLRGEALFQEIALQLQSILATTGSFVAIPAPGRPDRLRSLSWIVDGVPQPVVEVDLAMTPAAGALQGRTVVIVEGVTRLHPDNLRLPGKAIEGYLAVPLLNPQGVVIGVIGVINRAPLMHPRRMLVTTQLFAERTASEVERQQSDERFIGVFEHAPEPLLIVDAAGRIVQANRRASETFGYSPDELLALGVDELVPAVQQHGHVAQRAAFAALNVARRMGPQESRLTARRKDGSVMPVEVNLSPFDSAQGRLVVAVVRDLTARERVEAERSRLEEQLRQAQKMEALGTLAGGIAHDFNNVLTAIVANAELAREDPSLGVGVAENLGEIVSAAGRAGDLVKQILAFSRKQATRRVITRLETVVDEAGRLLRAALPAGIELAVQVDGNVPGVMADATQLHQVVMNLGTNAWHAIPRTTGRVTLRVDGATVADGASPAHDVPPGRYARLQVTDDGSGMDAATLGRIFEPFFTTKEVGKGTGLGLAVVHGIVAEHGGAVTVESTAGQGTTFTVYLPQAVTVAPRTTDAPPRSVAPGVGRVLYLDDEGALTRVGRRILERLGYEVTTFVRPADALAAVRAEPSRYDVVVTDQNMPEISGVEVAAQLAVIRPELPVVLMSGNWQGLDEAVAAVNVRARLDKPFSVETLGQAVQGALRPR